MYGYVLKKDIEEKKRLEEEEQQRKLEEKKRLEEELIEKEKRKKLEEEKRLKRIEFYKEYFGEGYSYYESCSLKLIRDIYGNEYKLKNFIYNNGYIHFYYHTYFKKYVGDILHIPLDDFDKVDKGLSEKELYDLLKIGFNQLSRECRGYL